MITEVRDRFNADFRQENYLSLVEDIHNSYRQSLVFRLSETPLFLSDELYRRLCEAAYDILEVVRLPGYASLVKEAIPPGMAIPGEDSHPTFLQIDFAICKDENGDFTPQLIELQGFPSLYCFQHYLAGKIRDYFEIPAGMTALFSGLNSESYKKILGRLLLGESDPENVVLLELQPHHQKTRLDFYITEEYFGIKPVCITEVRQRGSKLYYQDGGREVPINRIYHRFIFDELIARNIQFAFDVHSEIDAHWVGHPNWFFKVSKYTMPLINSRYAPSCYYLKDLAEYPENLDQYVLKPLFSFAGTGVQIDVTAEFLDKIKDRNNYILQKKVAYVPVIRTPDDPAKAEVRMMFLWEGDQEPILVNNLLRMSKGKMMGVDYNKERTWVGSSVAYHLQEGENG